MRKRPNIKSLSKLFSMSPTNQGAGSLSMSIKKFETVTKNRNSSKPKMMSSGKKSVDIRNYRFAIKEEFKRVKTGDSDQY